MSVQFGRWNLDGQPVDDDYLQQVCSMIAPYGPDGGSCYKENNVAILHRAFHTTKESHQEVQPCLLKWGQVLTWDGRLDNRETLISQLEERFLSDSPDISIVAAAYERWGNGCFAKLIGDWALAVWNPTDRSVVLAKDFVGTRHLYYSVEKDHVTWSTILDPLVLLSGRVFTLEEEYIAGWLAFFPAPHLTPYVGIQSVAPSTFTNIAAGRFKTVKYWDFDPSNRIHCRTDHEYEERFRTVFAESVRRRLRAGTPILAELSGGVDSSSIVCMADRIIAQAPNPTTTLDTVSYFDDSEPNWNERPYFETVEQQRGRAGCHIDVSGRQRLDLKFERHRFAATPGSGTELTDADKQFKKCLQSQGMRVVLSGIGGDEILGGVPTPTPELADLLAAVRIPTLTRRLVAWAITLKKPALYLLADVMRQFLPVGIFGLAPHKRPVSWLDPSCVRRNRRALEGYEGPVTLFGPRPSFQLCLGVLEVLRRQLACIPVLPDPLHERRYPYLDRDLLEFLYAIPRDQLVRPGHRRSLMRRALSGIVPLEILNRRRKAFVTRGPVASVSASWAGLMAMSQHMVSDSLRIVNSKAFMEALERARIGSEIRTGPMMRTLGAEYWLQQVAQKHVLSLEYQRLQVAKSMKATPHAWWKAGSAS